MYNTFLSAKPQNTSVFCKNSAQTGCLAPVTSGGPHQKGGNPPSNLQDSLATCASLLSQLEAATSKGGNPPSNLRDSLATPNHCLQTLLCTLFTHCPQPISEVYNVSAHYICDGHTWGLAQPGWTGGGGGAPHRSVFILARASLAASQVCTNGGKQIYIVERRDRMFNLCRTGVPRGCILGSICKPDYLYYYYTINGRLEADINGTVELSCVILLPSHHNWC